MNRKLQIEALLKRAEIWLLKISKDYETSLHSKHISLDMLIDIKEYFSCLRSILDYLAHDIVEKYCPNANPKNNLYFPIRHDESLFKNDCNKYFPELEKNNTIVYGILENFQAFRNQYNSWLKLFNKLNNENKHERLVPQARIETRQVTVTGQGGGSVKWGSGVTFGNGVSIMGVPIDPGTQLPVTNNTVKTEIITWVDFQFENINVSAIWLTKESLKRINDVFKALSKELYIQ